jgi:hypothetical protein
VPDTVGIAMVPAKLPPSCTRRWGCGPVPVVPRSCRCRAQRSRYRAGASGRRTRRIRQQHTSVAMQSIAAVPAVATTPTTSAIMSQTLGVTSTWSGGRGSGIRPSGRAEAAMLKSLVAGATEMISFPSGIALPTRFGHARGTTAGGCGGAACRSYTAAWRQQVRRPTWRRSCDLLDPHGERSCAGPSGPDSARPSQWAVAGHVTSVGVGGLDPHGCGR